MSLRMWGLYTYLASRAINLVDHHQERVQMPSPVLSGIGDSSDNFHKLYWDQCSLSFFRTLVASGYGPRACRIVSS